MNFPALLEELDRTVANGTPERAGDILRRIADLFTATTDSFSDRQIDVFDELFVRLSAHIERSARVALAFRLADNPRAPKGISRLLAGDDEIGVAAPLLERSRALDSATLVSVAREKSQRHLLALTRRATLEEAVTDVLVERGEADVVLSAINNNGARFSENGFGRLVERSEENDDLATGVGLRPDIPREHLTRLLVRASHAVRRRLELASPQLSGAIQEAVNGAATAILDKAAVLEQDQRAGLDGLRRAHAHGALDEASVARLAASNEFEKTAVALGLLCGLGADSVERALRHPRTDGVLVLAKAAGLTWPTAKAVLRLRRAGRDMSPGEYDRCATSYAGLKESIARQAIAIQKKNAAAGQGRPAA